MGRYRIGIDIGGTFTDFMILDQERGSLEGFKVPTVRDAPERGVLEGLEQLAAARGITPRDIDLLIHGTTVGVNALLQRTGADLALVVTEGFRDLLNLQRVRLPNVFSFHSRRPEPLIPRQHVFELRERMRVDGTVERPLFSDDVDAVGAAVRSAGLDQVVICLLHAYRNPRHEREAAERLRTRWGLTVTCSHEVWPEFREYERATAAVIDAYVKDVTATYLERLREGLAEFGVASPPLITRSNGGIMSLQDAVRRPILTLLSGPASGVVGVAYVASRAGYRRAITFDMGGTSADLGLVVDGQPLQQYHAEIGDFPVVIPCIDIASIGAGGGSIARLDASGLLKVGTDSAGSNPGPACYGRGGTEPTVTDAMVVTGLIPDRLAGGRVTLDVDRARRALMTLSRDPGVDPRHVADGVIDVTLATMYRGFNNVLYRRGIDPSDFVLVPYGGAGPVLGCLLAEALHIRRVLVPRFPGMLCALGALTTDLVNDYVVTVGRPLRELPGDWHRVFESLAAEARDWVRRQGIPVEGVSLLYSADMNYDGQSFSITVPLDDPKALSPDALRRRFHDTHQQIYRHSDPSAEVELVNLRLTVVGHLARPPLAPVAAGGAPRPSARAVFRQGREFRCAVYQREDLGAGAALAGPAIVEQADSATFVPEGWSGRVDTFGNLILTHGRDGEDG